MNTGKAPMMILYQDCDQVVRQLKQILTSAGFLVIQTFDLESALVSITGYCCPDHGIDLCSHRLVVLLVYPRKGVPVTLMLHGSDGRTCISVVNEVTQRADHSLADAIAVALTPDVFGHSDPGPASYGVAG